jgi:hypothetical protein
MRKLLLLSLVPLSLLGCTTIPTPEPTVSTNPCKLIPVPVRSAAEAGRLADEVAAAPPDARWPVEVQQYVAMRAEVRACAS